LSCVVLSLLDHSICSQWHGGGDRGRGYDFQEREKCKDESMSCIGGHSLVWHENQINRIKLFLKFMIIEPNSLSSNLNRIVKMVLFYGFELNRVANFYTIKFYYFEFNEIVFS
jgi:hypothetical protein